MRKLIHKLLCRLNIHGKKGYPQGLDNGHFIGIRVEYYSCEWCGVDQYKITSVTYGHPGKRVDRGVIKPAQP